jgi:hypothetical protein
LKHDSICVIMMYDSDADSIDRRTG